MMRNGNNEKNLFLLQSQKEIFQHFTTKHNVCHRTSLSNCYQLKDCYYLVIMCHGIAFYMDDFCIYWHYHITFLLYLIKLMIYTDFSNSKHIFISLILTFWNLSRITLRISNFDKCSMFVWKKKSSVPRYWVQCPISFIFHFILYFIFNIYHFSLLVLCPTVSSLLVNAIRSQVC